METATLHVICAWCVLIYSNSLKIDVKYNRNEYLFLKAVGMIALAISTVDYVIKTLHS